MLKRQTVESINIVKEVPTKATVSYGAVSKTIRLLLSAVYLCSIVVIKERTRVNLKITIIN